MNIVQGVIGGAIVAGAFSLHLKLKGRLASVTEGLKVSNFLDDTIYEKLPLICGLLLISSVVSFFQQLGIQSDTASSAPEKSSYFDTAVRLTYGISVYRFGVSGLLLGAGAALARGCFDVHGIQGLARLQKRSITGFVLMFFVGIVTVYHTYESGYLVNISYNTSNYLNQLQGAEIIMVLSVLVMIVIGAIYKYRLQEKAKLGAIIIYFLVGILYGIGLIASGIVHPSVVLYFLQLSIFDSPFLYFWLTALAVCAVTFKLIINQDTKPVFEEQFDKDLDVWRDSGIDVELIIGAILFGVGWGLTGITPASGIALVAVAVPQIVLVFFPMLFLGASLGSIYDFINFQPTRVFKSQVQQSVINQQT